MSEISRIFKSELLSQKEIKIIINKTNNKNTYCRFVDGSFVVNLGKHHDENDAIRLVNKLERKIANNNSERASLHIDFELNTFRLFGDLYSFVVSSEDKKVDIYKIDEPEIVATIKIRLSDNKYVEEKIQDTFIKKEFFTKISELQAKWENIMGLQKHAVSIIKKKTSWGSNSLKSKTITYNFFLHNFSEEIIESVVIHELAHDIHHNHSDSFYKYVIKYCPNYKKLHSKNQKHIFK